MVTRIRSTLAVLVSTLMASCASGGGGSGDFDAASIAYRPDLRGVRYSFESPTDDVVEALPDVYTQLGFPGNLDSSQDELLFISPVARAEGRIYEEDRNSEYLDCGQGTTGPRADTYVLEFGLVTRITSLDAGGTEIEVVVSGFGHDRFSSQNSIPCRGTGKFAGQIASLLRQMLAA